MWLRGLWDGQTDCGLNISIEFNKAGYTATKVVCGWAGAVLIKANSGIWAGSVMQKTPKMSKMSKTLRATNRSTF